MSEGESIEWELDVELVLPAERQFRVLRREISPEGLQADMAPFKESPAFWLHRHNNESVVLSGVLRGLRSASNEDAFEVYGTAGLSSFAISRVERRTLVVWRADLELDMLQVWLRGADGCVYGQLGGAVTLPVLAESEIIDAESPALRRARELYLGVNA